MEHTIKRPNKELERAPIWMHNLVKKRPHMQAIKLSSDLRPLSDIKTRTKEVVQQAEQSGRPVVLTRYGRGVAVLMSVETFEEYEEAAARVRLYAAMREAHRSVEAGDTIPHKEMDTLLARLEQGHNDSDT